jgi:serine/threonine protein phosphatase 1
MRKFAVSDIHGCNLTFNALLKKIEFSKSDELFLLGDYIDRGPDSKGVIDTIFKLQESGHFVKCLRGNHEYGILESRNNLNQFRAWHSNWGGRQTMESFGVFRLSEIERRYWNFWKELPYFFEVDNYILVHAGMNFNVENPMKDTDSMMWARGWYKDLNKDWLNDRIIVHGHTPVSRGFIESQLEELNAAQVLNIDNGCFRKDLDMGRLCAFEMTERKLFFQSRLDTLGSYYA